MNYRPEKFIYYLSCLAGLGLVLQGAFAATPEEEAQELTNEAVRLLRSGSATNLGSKVYMDCVEKLEKALQILEESPGKNSVLLQEVNATLFWARKFTSVPMSEGHYVPPTPSSNTQPSQVTQGSSPTQDPEPAKKIPIPVEPPSPPVDPSKKIFSEAEEFAKVKANDPFLVALRWQQVIQQLAKTEYEDQARVLAHEAQERFAAGSGAPDQAGEASAAQKKSQEADALFAAGKIEEALSSYRESLKAGESVAVHRKLGHACFDSAEKIRAEVKDPFEQAERELAEAKKGAYTTYRGRSQFDPSSPALVAAQAKIKELYDRAAEGTKLYNYAQLEFKAVLRMMPGNVDLDAAAHSAFCLSSRGDMVIRVMAISELQKVLAEYRPMSPSETTVYEKCKAEIARLKSKGK